MSKIEWTQKTWNPIVGCTKISEGCKNCYAIRMAWRLMHNPAMKGKYDGIVEKTPGGNINWTGQLTLSVKDVLEPLANKIPTVYFVNSMSDLFHERMPLSYIHQVFITMSQCRHHIFQVLTKRADLMLKFCSEHYPSPLPNVWLGISVENQDALEKRFEDFIETPAAIHFLSCEPLLGPIQLPVDANDGSGFVDWVIVGGESGPGARPMHPDWARSLRDQCRNTGAKFFFKQWGNWRPPLPTQEYDTSRGRAASPPAFLIAIDGTVHCFKNTAGDNALPIVSIGKKKAGRFLDGREHNDMPSAAGASMDKAGASNF